MEALQVTPRGKLEEQADSLNERIAYLEEKMDRFSDQGLNTFMIAMELGQLRKSLAFIARVRGD